MPTRGLESGPGAFEDAAHLLKALGHPLRLRMVCGLCRKPSNLTRIVGALSIPISTAALHLGVLRRAGILREQRSGTEVTFEVESERVRRILGFLCHPGKDLPAGSWEWSELARSLGGGRRRCAARQRTAAGTARS